MLPENAPLNSNRIPDGTIDTTAAINVGVFTSGQKQFLDFHRAAVLLQSDRG
jgi:hypothetical protein